MTTEIWLVLGAIGAIAFLAGFIHSAIGFGFGIVAISVIPFVIDVRSAHVVVSISSVPMLAMAAWAYREGIEWTSIKPAMWGAAICLPLGLALFITIPLDLLVRGTGLAILCVVWISFRGTPDPDTVPTTKGSCFVAGALSGFLGGAVSIAGPPVAAFALKQDWPPIRFKAFVSQCMLVIATYKAVLLWTQGFLTIDMAVKIAIASILAIIGVHLGAISSRKVSPERFRRLVAVSLVLVSLMMLWRGQPNEERQSEGNRPDAAATEANRTTGFPPHSQALDYRKFVTFDATPL